jgi:hypothetical protein
MMIASLVAEWEEADIGHSEFVFTNLAGLSEVGYLHGAAETRTKMLKWLLTVPLGDPETHSDPQPTEDDSDAAF